MTLVNLQLMKRPSNWITVWIMLTLAGVFGHLILTWAGKNHMLPATSKDGATKK